MSRGRAVVLAHATGKASCRGQCRELTRLTASMSQQDGKNDEKLGLSTLSLGERENDEAVDGQSAIAELLEVTVKTIQRWLKKPGNPGVDAEGRYPVQKWRDFAIAVGRKTRMPDKAAAELQGIMLKNERLRLENEVERGQLASVNEVVELLGSLAGAMAQKLSHRNHELAPVVVGVTVPEASKRIRTGDVKVLAELAIPDWAKKKVGPPGIFWSKVSRLLSGLRLTESPGDGLSCMSSTPSAA